MNCNTISRTSLILSALSLIILLATFSVAHAEPGVLGSSDCGECHTKAVKIWKKTKHYRTYRELHRRPKAKKIAKKMGIKRVRSEGLCQSCHYTTKEIKGSEKTIEGISCESCHGPAKDWLDAHSSYGSDSDTRETETAAHKKSRLAKVDAAGMMRRDHMYEFSAACYECHTTPEEKLVNVGGHPAGSEFELLSWMEGEVLHNVFYSDGKANQPLPVARRRKLFVVGLALDAEYAFRGVAKASKKATYALEMAKRAKRATQEIYKVAKATDIAELKEMVSLFKTVKLSIGNTAALNKAADSLAKINKKFVANNSGEDLASLDAFLPKRSEAVGERSR